MTVKLRDKDEELKGKAKLLEVCLELDVLRDVEDPLIGYKGCA